MKTKTREIALIITFTALTIALTPFRIPTVILPGVYFSFNDIPVIVAFLLFTPGIGISIAALKMVTEMVLFPAPTAIVGRPIIFVLTLSTLFGIYLARRLLQSRPPKNPNQIRKPIIYYTAFGAGLRTIAAPLLNYPHWLYVIPALTGIKITAERAMALVPAFMIVAFVLALYTVPTGYLIARLINKNLKMGNKL